MNPDVDIVIVGGGAAGIGAARRLAGTGLTTRLLEAGTRLGGRGWTQEIRGLHLDLGCGWLHSADRNSWVGVAEAARAHIVRDRATWGSQHRDLNFTPAEQAVAWRTFEEWERRLAEHPPASDVAADALVAGNEWNGLIRAIVSFISGATLENLSVADYVAYEQVSSDKNWRARDGYGALIASSFPHDVELYLATPVTALEPGAQGVTVETPAGTLRARAVIVTVSTNVLAGDSIRLPREFDTWRDAARRLPLGLNEKLFFEIVGDSPFETETHVTGDPRDATTASYYIRPFGFPVVECFFGGERARRFADEGLVAGFSFALDQLVGLFGANVRRSLRPMVASSWQYSQRIGGAYSYALPGHVGARAVLARPFDDRVFFAGEATSSGDFSTAHGAHDSGVRAATEVLERLKASR